MHRYAENFEGGVARRGVAAYVEMPKIRKIV